MARPPVQIPWPLSSAPGASPQESAGRLIGCYAEPLQPESGPGKVVYRRSAGLSTFATTGQTGFRGGLLVNNLLFSAWKDRLITTDSLGVVADVGALSGTLPVTFSRNNLTPTPQIVTVTENGAFVVTSGSIVSYPDADLPQPNSVAFQDSYFFYPIGDRRAFASGNNTTAVDSSAFVKIQSRADDTLLRAIPYGGQMYFFCSSSCEIYADAGSAIAAPAFPYARQTVIDRGLLGASAIAGYEQGFGKLIWAADDNGVYRFQGYNSYSPEKISPPDLDRAIAATADKTTLRASCYVNTGHAFWAISSPAWSWEFNLNTEKWNERWNTAASGLVSPRWRADGGIDAFGKWLMASSSTGNLVYVDPASFKEEGNPMLWRMESGPVQNFPNRTRIARADFYFATGVGIPSGAANEENPLVAISYSDDGGVNWSAPLYRELGRGRNASKRIELTNCGQAGSQGRRWRIEVTDGVYVGFFGATQSSDPRAY